MASSENGLSEEFLGSCALSLLGFQVTSAGESRVKVGGATVSQSLCPSWQ